MKKFLAIIFSLMFFSISTANAEYVKFNYGMQDSKPMAVLVYADWADGVNEAKEQFEHLQEVYGEKYNFCLLNIASRDCKHLNKNFPIYTNLPYLMLFKDKGKITRTFQKNCFMQDSCILERVKNFVN